MKSSLAVFTVLFTAFAGVFPAPGAAQARLDCSTVDGKWAGNMSGVYKGATTMTVRNCRASWKLPDGRTNICRYSEKAGKVEYSCSLGSRGTVLVSGNKITKQNTYTAHKHGAYMVRFSRTGG